MESQLTADTDVTPITTGPLSDDSEGVLAPNTVSGTPGIVPIMRSEDESSELAGCDCRL
jgi:hypothetical protein